VSIRGSSEIGWVADAFNTMAGALEQREHELHDAKDRAEKAAARITSIFESTTDSVLIIDRDWRISYSNARAKDLLDRQRDLTEMDLWQAFNHRTDTNFSDRLHEAMSTRRPVAFEALCRDKHIWLALNVYPSDQGLAIYFRDITQTKRALEAHRRIEEQLHQSQKMEAVGQLTGGIAHDFNNLLTVVAGNLELIGDRTNDDKLRQLAAAAQHAAARGATLIGQLLAFSRRQKLKPEFLYIDDIVREFHGLIRRAIGEGCDIRLLTDESLWACHLDPAQLQTAVLNLVLNGHDAMADGGVLEIETRNVVVTKDAIPGCMPGSYVRLSVRDTGCGMPPDVLARAFEPFFTTKEIGKGTGLGLSMVYGFVQQSGGHVAIESGLGVGTTVTLYLPKAQQESDNETRAIQAPDLPAGSERILVVEDDESVLGVTSEMLTDLGYRVSIARSGTEAMRILESGEEFELLFSDIVMPLGMNGVELARESKRLKSSIKVLLTSGYARDILERHGAADEFPIIGKPFRRADLAQSVRSVLQEQLSVQGISQ
jgi:signal transduction histidine kinase